MDIVTGYQGKEHVKADQLRRLISGMAGDGTYVLETQNKLAATMVTANQIRIDTGDLIAAGGAYATVETPETLTIESGATGQKRIDLVVARYKKEASTSVESMELDVVKGTPVSYGDPAAPEVAEGSIADGDSPVEIPLYSILIDGLAPGMPEQLFKSAGTIDGLRDLVSQVVWEGSATSLDVELPGVSRSRGLLFEFSVGGARVGEGACILSQGANVVSCWGFSGGRPTLCSLTFSLDGDRLSFSFADAAYYKFSISLGNPVTYVDGSASAVTKIASW